MKMKSPKKSINKTSEETMSAYKIENKYVQWCTHEGVCSLSESYFPWELR